MAEQDKLTYRLDQLCERVEHLENVMYTTNGSPGLIERVRLISRLTWLVLAITSATFISSDGVRSALAAIGRWLGG